MEDVKILIVEDDMIIAAKTSLHLSNLGYAVTSIVTRGEEALRSLAEDRPDIVLLDINLKGTLDGIETATLMQEQMDIPIIYLTANADEATFSRARLTRPDAFITKPFRQLDLQHAIELTITRMAERHSGPLPVAESAEGEESEGDTPFILDDRIFVRHRNKMTKVFLAQILYVEADRNYCRICTNEAEYILAVPLKSIEDKLPTQRFLRAHRSYLVNLAQIDEVGDDSLTIGQKSIPISRTFRQELLKLIQTL